MFLILVKVSPQVDSSGHQTRQWQIQDGLDELHRVIMGNTVKLLLPAFMLN